MKIIVDAFGGDNAPLEVLKGCQEAVAKLGVNIILTGSSQKIKDCAAANEISLDGMEIEHTDDVFDIHEEPKEIIKSGKNTSMALGLKLLADGRGDAFVSAGSTGALVMGATFIALSELLRLLFFRLIRAAFSLLTPVQIRNAALKCLCSLL